MSSGIAGNYIERSIDIPVRETFIIEPSLFVQRGRPASLSDINDRLKSRKNLSIKLSRAPIDIDVELEHACRDWPEPNFTNHADIYLRSVSGSVAIRIWRSMYTRPRFALEAISMEGSVTVSLPTDFSGMLVIRSPHPNVAFSERLSSDARKTSEVTAVCATQPGSASTAGCRREYYVRCRSTSPADPTSYGEDRVSIEASNGRVRVQYNDDIDKPKELFLKLPRQKDKEKIEDQEKRPVQCVKQ